MTCPTLVWRHMIVSSRRNAVLGWYPIFMLPITLCMLNSAPRAGYAPTNFVGLVILVEHKNIRDLRKAIYHFSRYLGQIFFSNVSDILIGWCFQNCNRDPNINFWAIHVCYATQLKNSSGRFSSWCWCKRYHVPTSDWLATGIYRHTLEQRSWHWI